MLRFTLGRIPVDVHPSQPLFSALLAFLFWPRGEGEAEGWPASAIAAASSAEQATVALLFGAIWVGTVFVSLLAHEFGHALTARAFGYRPRIELVMLGGQTYPQANETIPWHKEVLLTAAGPLTGLLLSVAALIAYLLSPDGSALEYLFRLLFVANLIWSLLNLFPVLPLDGGKIATAVLVQAFGRHGFITAQSVGLSLCMIGALLAAGAGQPFLALMFGLFGARVVALLVAFSRGERVEVSPRHPGELALEQAEALFEEGERTRARRIAEALGELDLSAALRGRVHHLLGWIALKEGEGRASLDHFSQVGAGLTVAPEALAAAFSLVGDSPRALAFWEQAHARKPDPTVLHEWAGELIRAGREAEARALPGVELPRAFECAHRILFLRGDFQGAARLAVQSLSEFPAPQAAYDAACAHARAGQAEEAVALLQRAAELGFTDGAYAASDEDLGSLHTHASFVRWVEGLRVSNRS